MLGVFPLSQLKPIKTYYWLTLFSNGWFATATWVFFVQRYMSLTTFGIVDALAFGFGLLLEIPTGVIADLIGKKRAIQLAMLFLCVSGVIMGLAPNSFWLALSTFTLQIGLAFYSGSVEAYVYDSLIDAKQVEKYDRVISTGMMIVNVTAATATFLGGWLYLWDVRAPILIWSAFNAIGFVLSYWLKEPLTDSRKISWQTYWLQTKDGMQALFSPLLKTYLPIMWLILSTVYLWDWGMLRTITATFFGLPVTSQATIFAILPLMGVVSVKFLPQLRRHMSGKQGLFLFALCFAIAHLLIYQLRGWWGIIPLVMIAIVNVFSYPWTSVIINQVVESKHRATALSTMALLTKIPYIILSPVIGWLADQHLYQWFGFGVGCIFLGVVVMSLARRTR